MTVASSLPAAPAKASPVNAIPVKAAPAKPTPPKSSPPKSSPAKSSPASMTVHVYTDLMPNGVQDPNDPNLGGVLISLLSADGSATIETALTDASGNVTFNGLPPGTYELAVTPPTGNTARQQANLLTPIALASGATAKAIAGFYAPVTFVAHVYTDANANATQDAGDKNLAGVKVTLLNGDGTTTGRTALTNVVGDAIFSGLTPGSYELSITPPGSNIATQRTRLMTPVTLASGGTASAVEGLYASATLTANVYTDANASGVQDAGDANLAGVRVNLLSGNGAATGVFAVTGANGNVTFSGLKPGSYEISVATPAGDVLTQQTSLQTPIVLASGATASATGGFYAPATITAHVYTDANASGIQDAGDANLAGVRVNLLSGNGTATGLSAVTGANGNVTFSGLKPGSYEISVATPAGDIATQRTNLLTPIKLTSGGAAAAIEGVYAPATITAHAYTDANASGSQDAGDKNLAGVAVKLLTGNGVATGFAAVTDANGNATFQGLQPGAYEISFVTPAGDTVTQHTNVQQPMPLASGAAMTATMGVYAPATITAHVYSDANANGTQDAGDGGRAGVTVTLLHGDGTATGQSAFTDASGNVTFSALRPGDYEVSVTLPAGDTARQQTNVLTPVTLVSGGTASAIEGITVPPPVSAAGANSDVGLLAVGAPVYAAGAQVLTVGVGKQFQTIAAAIAASQDGDVILVDAGTYTNDFAVVNTKISLIAVGGRVTMNATEPPPNFKGILTEETDLNVVGFDFTNCRIPDADGHNGAGIRVDAGNLTLENDSFVGNQDGLLTNAGTDSITIDHCLFNDNGGADGNDAGNIHNVYIGAIASVTATNSVFENAQVGHEFKSRAAANTLTNNVFISGVGIGTGSYDIDLPNGGRDVLTNNTIIKGLNAENNNMVHFGGEGIPYSGSSLTLQDNLFQSTNPAAVGLLNQTVISATVAGNVLSGVDPSLFIQGPATATNNYDAAGNELPNASLVGVLPGATMIITDADAHTVVLQPGGQVQAVEGGAGLLTLDVRLGHIIAIGGSGGMDVIETAGVTGGNQYTTAAGSANVLDLVGLGMNTIDSEGTDTIIAGDGNETGVINGNATITGGAGNSQWTVNGTASIYTGSGSESITVGSAGSLTISGTNDYFALGSNGGTATWNTINAGAAVAGSVAGGALSMQVYSGAANVTTSSGGSGVVLHLDQGNATVTSLGADTIYAGAGNDTIIVSGAAKLYAGTGRLAVYGRSDVVGADVYGNGGDYLISGDTGNITYHGGEAASTVEATLNRITLIGGAGLMTINGGSGDTVVGGAGGIIYNDFGGGADTVTTLAGSTNLLNVSGSDVINSYGNDTITHSDGNTAINIYGNSRLILGDGNSRIYLAGNDTVTAAPTDVHNSSITVAQGANVSINVGNANSIHDAGGSVTVSVGNSRSPALSTVTVSGGMADLSTDPVSGISVTTSTANPVAITANGAVSIRSNGADTIHLGAGVAGVLTSGNGAQIWAGSGIATVSSSDGTSSDVTTVHGGSGSIAVNAGASVMNFVGGSGSSMIHGTYGVLNVTGGSGDIRVGWSTPYGATTNFVAGSGTAAVTLGVQGGSVQFGTGTTTVSGSDWAHATTYAFLAGQSGTDIINGFVVGWDKTKLGPGVSVVSQDTASGSAHFVLSNGASVTFAGISSSGGIFS